MKKSFIVIFLCSLFLTNCKKGSGPIDDVNKGCYITLNEDKRELGVIPSSDISMNNGAWTSPDQWQLSLVIKTKCKQIAGLNNDRFELFVNIWDNRLLKSEYDLVPGYSGGSSGGPKGTASIGIRPFKMGGTGALKFFDAMSGKITITKGDNGKLKTVTFVNIPLSEYNGQAYEITGRIEVE